MDKRKSKYIRKTSQRQERKAAKDIGGRVQTGSGNLRLGGGGDVRLLYKSRVECKFTDKDIYTLKLTELIKIQKQAIEGGLEAPVLQIAFRKIPYSRYDYFAVMPSVGVLDTIWKSTESKQIRLKRDELFVDLQMKGPELHMQFVNSRDARGPPKVRYYSIMSWDRYTDKYGPEAQQRQPPYS